MPANLEGCLVLGVFIALLIAIMGGGIALSRALDSVIPEIASGALVLATFLMFGRFAKRHS